MGKELVFYLLADLSVPLTIPSMERPFGLFIPEVKFTPGLVII